jgi:hypothetical protein
MVASGRGWFVDVVYVDDKPIYAFDTKMDARKFVENQNGGIPWHFGTETKHEPMTEAIDGTYLGEPCVYRIKTIRKHDTFGFTPAISLLESILSSATYACPGGHRKDGKPLEIDEDEELVFVSVEGKEEKVDQFSRDMYWSPGQCPNVIEIGWDYEYDDMGGKTAAYPIADGPCVEALGLDADEEYTHEIWTRMSERAILREQFRTLLIEKGVVVTLPNFHGSPPIF